MDIMVQGTATKSYTPDEVTIRLNFYTNSKTYEKALTDGTKNVESFIKDVLENMSLKKEDMKTESFRVYEVTKYDYEKKEQLKLGFAYEQSAHLKFDYSADKIAEFMEKTSKLSNPPKYYLSFNIKDMQKARNEVMSEAYMKAKEKAEVIATVAEMTLKKCVKTDFRPFEERVISNSNLDSATFAKARMMKETAPSAGETIKNIFTPEDVTVSETLYCLWFAE